MHIHPKTMTWSRTYTLTAYDSMNEIEMAFGCNRSKECKIIIFKKCGNINKHFTRKPMAVTSAHKIILLKIGIKK